MLTGWRLTVSKWFLIPQRYILAVMGTFAVVNAYTMRISLSIAITEMVIPTNKTELIDPNGCQNEESETGGNHGIVTDPSKLYDWDETTQGLILSSFYWGYVLTHLPGGMLAEKYGGKYSLGLGILSTAILTLLTPAVVIYSKGDPAWIIGLRVLEGLGEGTTYPALNVLLAKWVPVHERAKLGSLVYAGGQIGTVMANLISGALIEATKDWASVFYVFGSIGILWFIILVLICYSEPQSHPFISDKERTYLEKELAKSSSENLPVPWKMVFTSMPVWALIFAQIGHDWGFFAMVTDLPKYMKDVLKFNVGANGLWSSLPYVVMWIVSLASGWLCDWIVKRGYMTITFARKFFTTIAAIGPGIFILVAAYVGCDRMLAVGMFTIAMGIMGTFYCGMKVNALDLSPNFAGTVMALVNGIGALTGIIVPYLIGALTEDHTQEQWRLVFWITLGVFIVTSIIYLIWGSGETQWWNEPNATRPTKSDDPFDKNIEKGIM